MRIVLLSDTHDRVEGLHVPDGDLLVHTGDFTMRGREDEVRRFLDWFASWPHPHKVFIAGNHDFLVERDPERFREMLPEGLVYLEDEAAEVAGLRVYGSPVTPWFHDWAFNVQRGPDIAAVWERIPEGTELLLTHGPPRGILDRTAYGEAVGCDDLAARVAAVRPRWHVFGHIHESRGELVHEGVHYLNASVLDRRYAIARTPLVLDV